MGVNRNLLGGIALRDAIKASMPSATINDEDKYIQFSASAATSISISEAAGMVFKPNTQYTFILSLYKITSNNNKTSNLRVSYTDSTWDNIPNLSAVETKETIVFTSDAGETIDKFYKINSSSTTRVYYDESGIFEGVLTTLDFEPYQAWGITMSGIRRSLVEAALHDDSTVAAPIATFTTDVSAPAKSVLAAFSPIQDLHGYSNPWPAGGGVNKLNDSLRNIMGHSIFFGGATNNTEKSITLPAGTYTITGKMASSSAPVNLYVKNLTTGTHVDGFPYYGASGGVARSKTFTLTEETDCCVWTYEANISSVDDIVFVQIETGSSFTTYSPYSNICPISGRTGLTAYRTGMNILPNDASVFSPLGFYMVYKTGIPDDAHLYTVLEDNDTSVDASDVSFGYCSNAYVGGKPLQLNEFRWIRGAGGRPDNITSEGSRVCGFMVYPQSVDAVTRFFQRYKVMCVIGDSGASYEPYTGTSYPVSWQTEAGTVYGGTVDIVSGVLTVDRAYALLDDSTKWQATSGTVDFRYVVDFNDRKLFSDSFAGLISSYLPADENASNHIRWLGASQYRIGIRSSTFTLEQIQQDATAGKIAICYPLATPLTYQLTPAQIQMLLGANNVWSDSNGDTTVQYWLHG